MEDDWFYEGDDRTRLLVAKGPKVDAFDEDELKPSRTQIIVSLASAVAFLAGAISTSGIIQVVFFWLACSLAVGPFAPPSRTGGDCRVGLGEPLPPEVIKEPEETAEEKREKTRNRGRLLQTVPQVVQIAGKSSDPAASEKAAPKGGGGAGGAGGGRLGEWTAPEVDALRKALLKHPKGVARRWEIVANAIGTGRSVDDVVKMAKQLAEMKPSDQDAYAAFLAQRRPNPKAGDAVGSGSTVPEAEEAATTSPEMTVEWSHAASQTLLKALKEFPKDTPLRWDRVAAAVGMSKAACMKRYAVLKADFRGPKEG